MTALLLRFDQQLSVGRSDLYARKENRMIESIMLGGSEI